MESHEGWKTGKDCLTWKENSAPDSYGLGSLQAALVSPESKAKSKVGFAELLGETYLLRTLRHWGWQ